MDSTSTEPTSRTLTYAQALNETLREEMARDPTIILLGEDIGAYGGLYTVTRGLIEQFSEERVRDTPISESGFLGIALGLARTGFRPVVELMFADFVFVAADPLFNQIAKSRFLAGGQGHTPIVVRTQQGGGFGKGAQHSQSVEALFCHFPGWTVVAPSTAAEAKGLLKTALRYPNPVAFLEHKGLYFMRGDVTDGETPIPFGRARIAREGHDVTVVTYSRMVHTCLEAADRLGEAGVSAEVIDLRTLVPLDMPTVLGSVRKTGRAVVAHESHRRCGVGAEICAEITEQAFDYLDGPVVRVGARDLPIPFSRSLESFVLPGVESVVQACLSAVAGSGTVSTG